MARFSSCTAWMKKVGIDYRAIKTLVVVSISASSLIVVTTLDGETVNPKVLLLSLVQLENNLRNESRPEARAEIAKSILNTGAPLIDASMTPSIAKAVAKSRKSGGELPEDQKGYVGFWLLRAVAAVLVNDERAGVEAATVLKQLGMAQSDKPTEINIMASLMTKGWYDPQRDEVRSLQELSTSITKSLGCHDSEEQSMSALIEYLEKSNAYPLESSKRLNALLGHISFVNRTDIPEDKLRTAKTKFDSLIKDLSKQLRGMFYYYNFGGTNDSPKLPTPQEMADIVQYHLKHGETPSGGPVSELKGIFRSLAALSANDQLDIGCYGESSRNGFSFKSEN